MRIPRTEVLAMLLTLSAVTACHSVSPQTPAPAPRPGAKIDPPITDFVGFDRNLYPGDDRLTVLHKSFAFVGYWLNNPPESHSSTWLGKRQKLVDAGFGFLVLFNGRVDAEIKHSKLTPEALGQQDAKVSIAAAKTEGFPAKTIVFLDQEEGGRLLPEQAAYFFAWTEAVAASGYLPGSYLSGVPLPDGNGPDGQPVTITTAQDIRQQVAAKHLHPVALWVFQDTCLPAPGCTIQPPHLKDSGTFDATVWQYAQSPREPDRTHACVQTYAKDNMCYAGVSTDLSVDLDVAGSADPSHGR